MLQKIDFQFQGITEELLMVDEFLSSPHPYEQGLVKYVYKDASFGLNSPMEYLEHCDDKPIKVEGYERLNATMFRECQRLAEYFGHIGYVSCHLFISPKGSSSFSMHTDPDDVVVHVITGGKDFESIGQRESLKAGDALYIPRNHPHRAINTDSSLMLSFGLELFLEQKL
jgi:hypothetical protein